jgi:hypothetical protein
MSMGISQYPQAPFQCRLDSGQIGFIYITKELAEAEGINEAL